MVDDSDRIILQNAKIISLQTENLSLKNKVTTLESELVLSKKRLDDVDADKQEKDDDIADMKSRLVELEKKKTN